MMARDKLLHFAFGLAAALAAIATVKIRDSLGLPAACLAAAVIVGVCYEVAQRIRGDGEPSAADAAATAAGGGAVALALLAWAALR